MAPWHLVSINYTSLCRLFCRVTTGQTFSQPAPSLGGYKQRSIRGMQVSLGNVQLGKGHGIGGSNVHCVENRNLDGYILIVLCCLFPSLLRSKLPGVCEKVSCMLQGVVCSLRTASLKGQQALLSELDR